jgi:caffeoyl-CoA O-methyltransferase
MFLKAFMVCAGMGALLMVRADLVFSQGSAGSKEVDAKVEDFLNRNRSNWHDWNVPFEDGRVLYDLIIKHHYRAALEIGTSTGHSAIRMAWALSKTGGRLITIEIDENRYREALKNFRQAGVEHFIDARLADAHRLVKELGGPFDFIFSDADKEWYTQYFVDLEPKLAVGGCFAAHNVAHPYGGIRRFLDHIRALPNYRTTVDRSSSAGLSISYKTK